MPLGHLSRGAADGAARSCCPAAIGRTSRPPVSRMSALRMRVRARLADRRQGAMLGPCHDEQGLSDGDVRPQCQTAGANASERGKKPRNRPLLGRIPGPDAFASHVPRRAARHVAAAIGVVVRAVWSWTGSMATSLARSQSTRATMAVKTLEKKLEDSFQKKECAHFRGEGWSRRPVRSGRRGRAAAPGPARRTPRGRGRRSRARGRAPRAARRAR